MDFHCKRLAAKLKEDYADVWHKHHVDHNEQYGAWRTDVKSFSFQRAYGAGVAAIVEDTGMAKADVEALIAAELVLYPGIELFDKRLEATITRNAIQSGLYIFINGIRFPQMESHWDSPTGTRYRWRQSEAPQFMKDRGVNASFKPTERKNYCVQGFGGEIMQTMLGRVWRHMVANDYYDREVLLVNTVHDCLLLDGKPGRIRGVAVTVQEIMESVPEVFNALYPDLNITVPFPVEAEVGKDLYTMSIIGRDGLTDKEREKQHDRNNSSTSN